MSLNPWAPCPVHDRKANKEVQRHCPFGYGSSNIANIFSDMDQELRNMEMKMHLTFRQLGLPRTGAGAGAGMLLPVSELTFFGPYVEHETEGKTEAEPGKYSMNLHLGRHMEPGDVKVSLKNGVMTIEAKKEVKSPDGSSRMYQEYMRKLNLPEKVNMAEVKTVLTPEGDLHIEVPLPKQALPQPREAQKIPIEKNFD